MQKKSSIPVILGYLYIVIPVIIFFIGWCNIYTAVFGTGIILLSLYFAVKNTPMIWCPENKKQIFLLVVVLSIIFLWVYSSGIGALVFQNTDHQERNGIFEVLIKQSWPVISPVQPIMLTYYIGFWLPSAVVGKIFNNIQIGYYFQMFWASLGIFLFFYYVLANLKHKNLFPIILFIFFSGLDIVGTLFTKSYDALIFSSHLERWANFYQYSCFTTQLYWVFNQAVPAWIITMLLLNEKNNKNVIFIYSCMFLHSTLPAMGILPILVYLCLKNIWNDIGGFNLILKIKQVVLSVISIQNVLGGLLITIVSYLYLSGNISGGNISTGIPENKFYWLYWLLFFMLEVGIYLFFLFNDNKKNILYYIITIGLMLYPFVIIGFSIDFCMRATIPLLVVLYLLILNTFDKLTLKNLKLPHYLLVFTLLIGSITPVHEIYRTIKYTKAGYTKLKPSISGTNFFAYTENNMFLKCFGKVKKELNKANN
ncbi:hypothetical protein IJ818_05040 [bacterium]|nr:hypothetical protein [bacterium]